MGTQIPEGQLLLQNTIIRMNNAREQRSNRISQTPRMKSIISFVALALCLQRTEAFLSPARTSNGLRHPQQTLIQAPFYDQSTSLNAWWFGGSQAEDTELDSCELVAVRIERTSANSRRIMGDITVPRPLKDVWAIITDYDRLAVHVPNLVESRIVSRPPFGEPGDGTFTCKLFQKGAQKIAGFEFGASVTMQMTEYMSRRPGLLPPALTEQSTAFEQDLSGVSIPNNERKISFKSVDSFFFNQFDGEWKAIERSSPDGSPETLLSYMVDVRPKGPVPVTALEWRIREDVPTNLRAVKHAAMAVGFEGVMSQRQRKTLAPVASSKTARRPRLAKFAVNWDENETMAAYINKRP